MHDDESDSIERDSCTSDSIHRSSSSKSRISLKPEKGSQAKHGSMTDDKSFSTFRYRKECEYSCSSKGNQPELRKCSKKAIIHRSFEGQGNDSPNLPKVFLKNVSKNDESIFPTSEIVINDCWRAGSDEDLVKFVEFFKDNGLDEDDANLQIKKRKLEQGNDKSPPYTKEFHLLTEVQKARILTVVEDSIKKIANEDYFQSSCGQSEKQPVDLCHRTSVERFFCKKFLLPWVIVKIVEMVLCHIIQFIFLSEGAYVYKAGEILPVVVTYYLTLSIILISLVIHISCFSYGGLQNPCYFMSIISSSILTLTTALGIFIMLTSMEYYGNFREILLLVFVVILLCSLFMELCLCYVELKSVWNRIGVNEQNYVS